MNFIVAAFLLFTQTANAFAPNAVQVRNTQSVVSVLYNINETQTAFYLLNEDSL